MVVCLLLLFLVFWWCDCDSLVANEVTLVAGWCWVNRETRIRSDWGGGCLFDVNHGIWINRVTLTLTLPAGRGSW